MLSAREITKYDTEKGDNRRKSFMEYTPYTFLINKTIDVELKFHLPFKNSPRD